MRPIPALTPLLLIAAIAAAPLPAQCGGNGGNGDLDTSPLALGSPLDITTTGSGGAFHGLFISAGTAVLAVPGVGTVCLDVLSPSFATLNEGFLPSGGELVLSIPIPSDPALLSLLVFLQGVVFDQAHPSGIALTQAHRIEFEAADGFTALPALPAPRALATGTLLRDGRVVIAGGGAGTVLAPQGTASCDLFDPLTRSMVAGPPLGQQRAFHTATPLQDGRVLVCGGVNSPSGAVTTSCEVFVPGDGLTTPDSWAPVASMSTPRAAHNATLLDDGRVLVCGGTTTFDTASCASMSVGCVLNAGLATGEVYDPVADAWTAVANTMQSPRIMGAATRLNDGRVLITAGLNGATSIIFIGEVPTWTATSNYYDPVTNLFSNAPPLGTGVAAHVMGTLPNGDVWLAGGAVSSLFIPTATNQTAVLPNGATVWSGGPNLPSAVALPGIVSLESGDLQLFGGAVGTLLAPTAAADSVRWDGASLSAKASLPAPVGVAVTVRLESGAVLVAGGADSGSVAVAAANLYTPDP